MPVLDTQAILAFLWHEPAAPEVRELLRERSAVATALGVAEAADRLIRITGADEDAVEADLGRLGLVAVVPVDATIGARSGILRARHYHRRRCVVSLADCVAAEVARSRRERLATSDPHLLDVCVAEGIRVIPLQGADGSRWAPPS